MTIRMQIERDGKPVEVECEADPHQESVDEWAQHRNQFYRLTAEEKAFAMNLALEKLEKPNDKSGQAAHRAQAESVLLAEVAALRKALDDILECAGQGMFIVDPPDKAEAEIVFNNARAVFEALDGFSAGLAHAQKEKK